MSLSSFWSRYHYVTEFTALKGEQEHRNIPSLTYAVKLSLFVIDWVFIRKKLGKFQAN